MNSVAADGTSGLATGIAGEQRQMCIRDRLYTDIQLKTLIRQNWSFYCESLHSKIENVPIPRP